MAKTKLQNQEHHSNWICDDRPKPVSPEIAAMTDEEIEVQYLLRFGKNLPKNEVDEIINFISDKYDGCLDWFEYYRDYFFVDSDSTKIMMKPDAPEEAAISFEIFREANNYHYNYI